MQFKQYTLDNGLTVIGEVNKAAKSAAVGFFVRTGSRDETAEISGVSHFLEHMLFKGTETLSAQEVNEAFDRTGAQFNAFTSEENTVYYAAVLPEVLEEITGLWAQLMRPSLRDDDFNIEKNVIKQEIAMYEDQPTFDVMDRCRSLHFESHPCGNSVLGTNETIDALSSAQMREYFSRRYAPNNMTLALSGNFDWDRVCEIAAKKCSNWKSFDTKRELAEFSGSGKTESLLKQNVTRTHTCLMSAGPSMQNDDRVAAALLGTIIGDDTGSRFFWDIVDKALAESAVMQFGPMDGTGAFYSYICSSVENAEKCIEIVNKILADIVSDGITGSELEGARNKTLSGLVLKNELPMGRLVELGFNWVYLNQYRTIEEEVQSIKDVTLEDIRRVIDQYKLQNYTQYSLVPAAK